MTTLLRTKDLFRITRQNIKCEAINFITDDGEIVAGRCRRRTCPLCWPSWAYHTAKALINSGIYQCSQMHDSSWYHLMLTLDESNEHMFPSEAEIEANYIFSRGKGRYDINKLLAGFIPGIRQKIHYSGREVSEFSRSLRILHGARKGLFPVYGRIVETGTKGTHRWHVHYVVCLNTSILNVDKDKLIPCDNSGFINDGIIDNLWKHGGIRCTKLYNGPLGIRYLSAYETKQSHSRFILDRFTSKVRKYLYAQTSAKCKFKAVAVQPASDLQKARTHYNRKFIKELERSVRDEFLRIRPRMEAHEWVQRIADADASASARR